MELTRLAVILYLIWILPYCKKKGEEDIEYVVNRVLLSPDLYNWNFYLSIEQLREYRKLALDQFISDYSIVRKRKRYLNAKLPKLPFEDKSFDLVLSGHLHGPT
jgi:hypothetical protein